MSVGEVVARSAARDVTVPVLEVPDLPSRDLPRRLGRRGVVQGEARDPCRAGARDRDGEDLAADAEVTVPSWLPFLGSITSLDKC